MSLKLQSVWRKDHFIILLCLMCFVLATRMQLIIGILCNKYEAKLASLRDMCLDKKKVFMLIKSAEVDLLSTAWIRGVELRLSDWLQILSPIKFLKYLFYKKGN